MVVRSTSIETYRQIEAEGLLSDQRRLVYRALFAHGPCTAGELAAKIDMEGNGSQETKYMVSRRLPELRDRTVAIELPSRICKIRNTNSIVWDVTANLPIDIPEKSEIDKKTKSDKLTWDFDMPGAIRDMRRAVNLAKQYDFQPTDRLHALRDWLTKLSTS
jgi:hypothetical protein